MVTSFPWSALPRTGKLNTTMSKPDDIAAAAPLPLPASAAADAAAVDAAELQRGLATDPDAVAAAAAAVHNLAHSARQATEEELASQAAARKRTEGRLLRACWRICQRRRRSM
jgi:hypothetical protein